MLALAAAVLTAAALAVSAALADLGHLRPDTRAVGRRPGGASAPVSPPVVVRVPRPGFDWHDAAIGAAAGAGLVLLLLAASLLIRRDGTEAPLA